MTGMTTPGQPVQASAGSFATTMVMPPKPATDSLWIWPAVGLAVIASSGAVFGPLGTVVAAVIGVPTLILYLGRAVISSPPVLLALATVPLVVAGGIIIAAQQGADLLARPAPTASTSSAVRSDPKGDFGARPVRPDDLEGRDLRQAHLEGAIFLAKDLSARNLRGARLMGASLVGVDLRDADLRDAYLRGADLRGADLRGACLDRADLSGALLDDVRIDGAHLMQVMLSAPDAMADHGWPVGDDATACPR